MASYSLGKLVKALGIPVFDRHRASGDAKATLKLFKMLLSKDLEKTIVKAHITVENKPNLTSNLITIIEGLPSKTGVYYIHNKDGEIVYIGKSKNIKKRITQHFTGTNSKSNKIKALVTAVTYEKTGSELAALLKENEEIKKNKPLLNRALKRSVFTHALYLFVDDMGYKNLKLDKAQKINNSIITFNTKNSGKQFLLKAVEDYNLCLKLTGLDTTKTSCFKHNIKECNGACINKESAEDYNSKVKQLIDKYSYKNKDMLIIDKGRDFDEKCAFLVENGIFKGFGYFDLNHQITNRSILESLITPMQNNRDTQHIIQSYLRRNKRLKIVALNS